MTMSETATMTTWSSSSNSTLTSATATADAWQALVVSAKQRMRSQRLKRLLTIFSRSESKEEQLDNSKVDKSQLGGRELGLGSFNKELKDRMAPKKNSFHTDVVYNDLVFKEEVQDEKVLSHEWVMTDPVLEKTLLDTTNKPIGLLIDCLDDHRKGIGEQAAKRVLVQIGSALHHLHCMNLVHLDVRLSSILIFDSSLALIKLSCLKSTRRLNSWSPRRSLFYSPPELCSSCSTSGFRATSMLDVFQLGTVLFICLMGKQPWHQPRVGMDKAFEHFDKWCRRPMTQTPSGFRALSKCGRTIITQMLHPDPKRRGRLEVLLKDQQELNQNSWMKRKKRNKWTRINNQLRSRFRTSSSSSSSLSSSQLTLGSFRSIHSNELEKNHLLSSLMEAGVETTVNRDSKTQRIRQWIEQCQQISQEVDHPHQPDT